MSALFIKTLNLSITGSFLIADYLEKRSQRILLPLEKWGEERVKSVFNYKKPAFDYRCGSYSLHRRSRVLFIDTEVAIYTFDVRDVTRIIDAEITSHFV